MSGLPLVDIKMFQEGEKLLKFQGEVDKK